MASVWNTNWILFDFLATFAIDSPQSGWFVWRWRGIRITAGRISEANFHEIAISQRTADIAEHTRTSSSTRLGVPKWYQRIERRRFGRYHTVQCITAHGRNNIVPDTDSGRGRGTMATQFAESPGEPTDRPCARPALAIASSRQGINRKIDCDLKECDEILHRHWHTARSAHIDLIGFAVVEGRTATCLVQPIVCHDAASLGNASLWRTWSTRAFREWVCPVPVLPLWMT